MFLCNVFTPQTNSRRGLIVACVRPSVRSYDQASLLKNSGNRNYFLIFSFSISKLGCNIL